MKKIKFNGILDNIKYFTKTIDFSAVIIGTFAFGSFGYVITSAIRSNIDYVILITCFITAFFLSVFFDHMDKKL